MLEREEEEEEEEEEVTGGGSLLLALSSCPPAPPTAELREDSFPLHLSIVPRRKAWEEVTLLRASSKSAPKEKVSAVIPPREVAAALAVAEEASLDPLRRDLA